jgi:hypothetical protein
MTKVASGPDVRFSFDEALLSTASATAQPKRDVDAGPESNGSESKTGSMRKKTEEGGRCNCYKTLRL